MKHRFITYALALSLLAIPLLACTNQGSEPGPTGTDTDSGTTGDTDPADDGDDMSQAVNLSYHLWGDEGVANQDVLAVINEKLTEDLNATIEISYIGWSDVSTRYPLLFTSGESFDLTHASPTAPVSYFTLAGQEVLVDITDHLDAVPTLRDTIPAETWDTARYQGRLYAVPTLYSEFTPHGYAYRTDFLDKYDLEPISSLETMEAYLAAVAEGEDYAPINGNSTDANNLYRLLIGLTGEWITAPGIPEEQMSLVLTSYSGDGEIIHPAFTDEFADWVVKMREWGDAGYWQQDILASQTGAKDNILNGISAGFLTHMPDWTGTYGGLQNALPGIYIDWWSPAVDSGKILTKPGVDNATAISYTSSNPVRALKVIEKFMTDQTYYSLIQNGIEGRQYEIVDGTIVRPESFSEDVDGYGLSVWSLRNDALNIPLATEDPVRYELIEEWKEISIDSPFSGFTFDPSDVTTELSNLSNVNSTLGVQLLLGKTQGDVSEALDSYRSQLESAGIEAVIEAVTTQWQAFLADN